MAKNDVVEVLADEISVPKAVNEFQNPNGKTFYQHINKTYFKGDKIPSSEVSPVVLEALEDKDNPLNKKLKLGSGSPEENLAVRLGLPFDGYDDMDEEDILAAMRVLPSPTVVAIQEYERQHEDREKISHYSIGHGISPGDFAEGLVSSEVEDGEQESKAVSKIKTRRVTDTEVEAGEGFTGTGDPQVPYGTADAQEGSAKKTRKSKSSGKSKARRSRRTRSASTSNRGRGSGDTGESGEGDTGLTGAGSADAQGTAE